MKQIIDIDYTQNPCGTNVYIEDVTYIENEKQYVRSTLMEIDPAELKEKYESIVDKTEGHALFRERPITPLNIIEVSVRPAVFDEREMSYEERINEFRDVFLNKTRTMPDYDVKWDIDDIDEDRYDHDQMIANQQQHYRDLEEFAAESK